MATRLNKPAQNTQLPMADLATLFMDFWHRDAGDFKHLGLKRTYEGTNYANIEQQTYNDAITAADNILRFNMYYIMQQIKNVKNVVVHFTRLGFITLDKKDEITSNNKHSSLMGLQFMKELIKIEKAKFNVVEKALVDTDNKKVWDLLKPATSVATGRQGTNAGSSGISRQPRAARAEDRWDCLGCTSPNPQTVHSCLVCTTPRATTTTTAAGWTCNGCTSGNEETLLSCSICDTPRLAFQPQSLAETSEVSGSRGVNAEAGKWTCPSCTYESTADVADCVVCGQQNLNRVVPLGIHGPQIICSHCSAGNVPTAVTCVFCEARLKDLLSDSNTSSDDSSEIQVIDD